MASYFSMQAYWKGGIKGDGPTLTGNEKCLDYVPE